MMMMMIWNSVDSFSKFLTVYFREFVALHNHNALMSA